MFTRHPIVLTVILFEVLALSYSSMLQANNRQDQIQSLVTEYLVQATAQQHQAKTGNRVEIEVSNVDPRLNLPTCSIPLNTVSDSRHGKPGRQTVKVECHGGHPWGIYVSANVKIFRNVVVATTFINKKSPVLLDQLTLKERNIAELRGGFYTSFAEIEHSEAKRSIRSGEALTPRLIQPQEVISKGDSVTIIAKGSGILVKMNGTALSNGQINEQIRVRNSRSEKIIRAIVTGPKTVEVKI